MKKIVKPHKVRKIPPSTGLAQYEGGKDNFKNIKEAYDYVNRNELNNALIAAGDGNIPMNQREYQITLPNVTVFPQKYDSTFDGSLDNTLSTLDAMTGGTIGMAPVLGDALDGLNILNDINKGNYANAGIGLGLLALPNFIEKPISKGKKLFNLSKNFIKNKAKAVNDFIGEGSAFLAYKYPNIFTGKYKGNKYLDDTIDKFYKEDVYGRYKKALYNPELNRNLPKELRDEYENIIGKNGNPSEIRTYLGSGDMLSFVSREKPKYIFARKSQLKNPDKAGQIIVHEGNHSQTGLLRKFIKRRENDLNYDINTTEFGGYAADDALNKAYNFSDEAYKKVNSPIDEKAATNREIRFDLFKRTGKTGNELDEVIDNLSEQDLKNLLSNQKSYYRRQFLKNFKSDTADYMRKALKIVPAALPIAIGASLYNDQDVDSNYNYKKGKDDHRYYDYIITQSMLGNPTAKRMTGEDDRYIPAFGPGDRSNIVLGSYGNYATPSVMNIGGELMYTPNPWAVFPEWMVHNQSFRFNNPNNAIDFAENYKYSSPAFPEFFGVDNSINYDKGKDSGIHIKKANRGKFTAAAKRAGMGVQAYARKILNAPKGKYSSTLRKRANFAVQAKKWN